VASTGAAPERRDALGAGGALEEMIAEGRAARARDTENDADAEEAASALTERVVNWIPDNLADAIRLLEFGLKNNELDAVESVLNGLRIIAGAGDAPAAEPVLGDHHILELFREWRAAYYDDDEAALARLRVTEKAIADMPATG
jgi:hypothetical protein